MDFVSCFGCTNKHVIKCYDNPVVYFMKLIKIKTGSFEIICNFKIKTGKFLKFEMK